MLRPEVFRFSLCKTLADRTDGAAMLIFHHPFHNKALYCVNFYYMVMYFMKVFPLHCKTSFIGNEKRREEGRERETERKRNLGLSAF